MFRNVIKYNQTDSIFIFFAGHASKLENISIYYNGWIGGNGEIDSFDERIDTDKFYFFLEITSGPLSRNWKKSWFHGLIIRITWDYGNNVGKEQNRCMFFIYICHFSVYFLTLYIFFSKSINLYRKSFLMVIINV